MNTIENNKLIADFMGLDSFKDSLASLHQGKINVDIDVYEQAQYHTSWDWLMPVVEKIKDIGVASEKIDNIDFVLTCDLRIKNLYQEVVEFIKWYNGQE